MSTFSIPASAWVKHTDPSGKSVQVVKKESLDKFNATLLGLGNIQSESKAIPAIAALFDLEGFTNFCKQIEPHLTVPFYLSGFLDWIFAEIRKETIEKEYPEGSQLWHELPFFTKFMGDGLLVLWDTKSMSQVAQHNLITSCLNILANYKTIFLPNIRRKISDPPPQLRCGIAKGTVFSVGDGNDYVGSCINISARLQKLSGLPIAFARRGFDPETKWGPPYLNKWHLRKVTIRGIGDGELVYVWKAHFEKLSALDKRKFRDP